MTDRPMPSDAIERAARAILDDAMGIGPWALTVATDTIDRHMARIVLASLRPGDKITLADGKECWIAPVEATEEMYVAGLRITRDSGYGHCHDAVGGAIYRAMRDACKEDEG